MLSLYPKGKIYIPPINIEIRREEAVARKVITESYNIEVPAGGVETLVLSGLFRERFPDRPMKVYWLRLKIWPLASGTSSSTVMGGLFLNRDNWPDLPEGARDVWEDVLATFGMNGPAWAVPTEVMNLKFDPENPLSLDKTDNLTMRLILYNATGTTQDWQIFVEAEVEVSG